MGANKIFTNALIISDNGSLTAPIIFARVIFHGYNERNNLYFQEE